VSEAAASHPDAGAIVAAILLPPLGVWMTQGIGPAFWVCATLTCLAFFPGMIFALIAVLRPDWMKRLNARFA